MRVLLNGAANTEAETDVGRRPLHWAARNGHSEAARMLLNAGAEKDVSSSHSDGGCSPLHLAVQQGKVATVRLLLECGASCVRTHSGGTTPLHDAARGGHVHVTALLLGVGGRAILDAQDGACRLDLGATPLTRRAAAEGATPLHLAAAAGELGTVRMLVENGADASRKSNVRTRMQSFLRLNSPPPLRTACAPRLPRLTSHPPLQSGRTPADCAKDEATLLVLRSAPGTAAGEVDTVHNLSLPVLARSPSEATLRAGATAAAPKPAAAESPALPEDLASWLAGLSLSAYAEPLGLVSLEDVEAMEEDDLKEAGMKPAERKRFIAARNKLTSAAE